MPVAVTLQTIGTGSIRTTPARDYPLHLLRWGLGEDEQLLLECSERAHDRVLHHAHLDIKRLHTLRVLCTHTHFDHVAGLIPLRIHRHVTLPGPGEFEVLAPEQVIVNDDIHWRAYNPEFETSLFHRGKATFARAEHGIQHTFGMAKVTPFKVFHSSPLMESVGFRIQIRSLVFSYTGDAAIPPEGTDPVYREGLDALFAGAHVVLADACGLLDKSDCRHLNAYEIGELANKHRVPCVILTHLSGQYEREELTDACRQSGFQGDVLVPDDGQQFNLSTQTGICL